VVAAANSVISKNQGRLRSILGVGLNSRSSHNKAVTTLSYSQKLTDCITAVFI